MNLSNVMTVKPAKGFGSNLRGIRERKGINRKELSNLLGLSYQTVLNWEAGVSKPAATEVGKIATTLDTTVCKLLNVKPSQFKFVVSEEEMAIDTLAERIKVARMKKGMSKNSLASLLNVAVPSIVSWEAGRTTPNIDMVIKLANALSTPIEFLLEGEMNDKNFKLPTREELVANSAKFAKRLKEVRLEHGLTQDQLAKAIKSSNIVVYKWEKGMSLPMQDSLLNLLKFFNLSFDEFLSSTEDKETSKQIDDVKVEANMNQACEKVINLAEITTEENDELGEKNLETSFIEKVQDSDAHCLVEGQDIDLTEEINRATIKAQAMMTQVMNQFKEEIVAEISKKQEPIVRPMELSEVELEIIQQVKQLDEAEMGMLQSYLNYLISKK